MNLDHIHETRNATLNKVKNIIENHISGKRARCYLFGSWARSQEKRSSDIDVAIEFETNDEKNRLIMMNVRHALEESTIPYKVDVVYLNEADDLILKKIEEEGILWGDHRSE